MKNFAFVITYFVFFSSSLKARLSPQSADEILKEAYDQASKENKNVFILFHASWWYGAIEWIAV